MSEKSTTVYYDGACPLCRREIALYQARSENVDFVDVSEAVEHVAPDLSQKDAMARFHVRTDDGTLLDGGAAFVALWRKTPGFRWLARVFDVPGMTAIANVSYNGFLRIRPAVQRLVLRFDKPAKPSASSMD